MKRRQLLVVAVFALMAMVLIAGCKPKAPEVPAINIEVVGKDGKAQTVNLAALETISGKGGFMKSTGTIVGPEDLTGVKLADVLQSVGGMTSEDALEVTASDGYTMTLDYEQASGHLMTYSTDSTALQVVDLTPILITSESGNVGQGVPRLGFVDANGSLSDGHFWVKDIAKLTIVKSVTSWEIKINGIESFVMDRSTYESLATCPTTAHPAVTFETTTKAGDPITYEGVPLWLLISTADGADTPDGHYQFNDELAQKGYTIEVVAADGYKAEFTSQEVARNQNIIAAYKANGEPLGEDEGPLKLVGSALPSGKHSVKNIAEINLVNLPE